MYRNREDVIAFTQFALQEIENLPVVKLTENMNIERNLHVLSSIDFERKLISRQVQVLDQVVKEPNPFFLSFSDYLDNLRSQFKKTFIERRLEAA